MKSAVIHFGCRLNQFESDGIKANLEQNSHRIVADQREADFIVVNTCTVTNKADYKNRAAIRRAHRLNPQAKIVVTGCYATTDAEEIRALPGVYRVIANDKKHAIAEALKPDAPQESAGNTDENNNRFYFSANHTFKSRATLKIQDGCNKSCSYCKIPQARGRGVSRGFDETLRAAEELIAAGFGELVLTGVNIGWYDDNGRNFNALVEKILNLSGNFHLRVSSIEPGDVGERFAALYQHEKMAKFLHIPLQSGSKFVLRTMRRGYTPEQFMRRIEHVRKIAGDIHIGTDIIVGFPSEGESEFLETLAFSRAAAFANIHIFPFSKRRNTPIVDWLSRREQNQNVETNLRAIHVEKKTYREVNGAVIRERIGRLAALKTELAAQFEARKRGSKAWAVVEKIEAGAVDYLTEHYMRGSIPTQGRDFRRGERIQIVYGSK